MTNERRSNPQDRSRLAAIQAGYEKWSRKTILILSTIAVVTCGLGVLSIYLLDQNSARVDEIQASRVEITLESCQALNRRHDATIRRLDELIAKIPPGPRRTRARTSRASTVLLIQALAPKQNCQALIEQRFGK